MQVAGEAGHGKTTFINNMFSSYNKSVLDLPLSSRRAYDI
jgi:septin family protein